MSQVQEWFKRRNRCRTDLPYLCIHALRYRDVGEPHRQILSSIQPLHGAGVEAEPENLNVRKLIEAYQPKVPMKELKGKRNRLILASRGFLKSSIVTQAHAIQWIINYPDIRILLVSAKRERAEDFLRAIKEHFVKNDVFRQYFPEFCPQAAGKSGKLPDFGTTEQFTVLARRTAGIKEPTVRIASADSSTAGGHYDVVFVDDLEEEQNSRTPDGIEQVKAFFAGLRPLVDTFDNGTTGWEFVSGTIWSFSGLHYTIREAELAKVPEQRLWKICSLPACENYPHGKLNWPGRVTLEYLKAIEHNPAEGPAVLYPQYLLQPLIAQDGLIRNESDIKWVDRKTFSEQIGPRCNWYVTVDLAGMDTDAKGQDNDFTAINEHGWTGGRCYFSRIFHGRFSPEQVIDKLFEIYKSNPRILGFKIQKDAMSRVLNPFLKAAQAKRGVFLPVTLVEIDNRKSKQQRIKGTQPFWTNGCFVFLSDLDDDAKSYLLKEAKFFPKFNHDDILDTIADALQNREGGVTSDVQGAGQVIPDDLPYGLTHDGSNYEWRGIPVKNLPAEMAEMVFAHDREEVVDSMTGF